MSSNPKKKLSAYLLFFSRLLVCIGCTYFLTTHTKAEEPHIMEASEPEDYSRYFTYRPIYKSEPSPYAENTPIPDWDNTSDIEYPYLATGDLITQLTNPNKNSSFLKLYETYIALGVGSNIEYTDNVALVPNNAKKECDLIYTPFVTANISRQIFDDVRFNLDTRLGKTYYSNNASRNNTYWVISPNSVLSRKFRFHNTVIKIYDKISRQVNPIPSPIANNTSIYKYTDNLVGAQMHIKVYPSEVVFCANKQNLWAETENFKSQTNATYTYSVSGYYNVLAAVKTGICAAHARQYYKRRIQNDSISNSLTSCTELDFSSNHRGFINVGYEQRRFHQTGTINDHSEFKSITAGCGLDSKLSSLASQSIRFRMAPQNGFGSNYFNLKRLNYVLNYQLTQCIKTSTELFYERIQDSGSTRFKANRYGLSVNANFFPIRKGFMDVYYRIINKRASTIFNTYKEHRIGISFVYFL